MDYLAALEQRNRHGVRPEDNAAVFMARATGLRELENSPSRSRYFKELGIEPIAVGGASVTWDSVAAMFEETRKLDRSVLVERWSQGMEKPWVAKDDLVLAKWLELNDDAIELMRQASQCSRYYAPLIRSGEIEGSLLMAVSLPLIPETRHVARIMSIRSMYRLGNDDLEGAFEDCLAIHRLARLIGQGPTLIDGLVGIAVDGMAYGIDVRIARHPKLREQQALRFRERIEKLAPFSDMAQKLDVTERYTMLDVITSIPRDGSKSFQSLMEFEVLAPQTLLLGKLISPTSVDWNFVLKRTNGLYDLMTQAMQRPTRQSRTKAFQAFETKLEELQRHAASKKTMALALVSKQTRSEWVSSVLANLMMGALPAVSTAQDRAIVKTDQLRLTYAISAYQRHHKRYPDSLDALTPNFIKTLPADRFASGPFRYRRTENGFVLYSVGDNGRDDGGVPLEARREGKDDLVVEVPAD